MDTRPATFASGHTIQVLAHRAEKHDFSTWEPEYIRALMHEVQPGDVVYDVGAEEGEFSALVATRGTSVHMFEPTPRYWPNIRAVFEANGVTPGGCWCGFAGDSNRLDQAVGADWPQAATGPIWLESGFSFVDERPDFPCTTLDDYAYRTVRWPNVIMCDVEGAEALVFKGASAVLSRAALRAVFVSVHPDSWFAKYGTARGDLFDTMKAAGFVVDRLGVDHEEHFRFSR